MQTFTEVIDYSAQASGRSFNTFSAPFDSNKIVLFLSKFGIDAYKTFFGMKIPTDDPVELSISPLVINTTHYQWTVKAYKNVKTIWVE